MVNQADSMPVKATVSRLTSYCARCEGPFSPACGTGAHQI